MLDTGYISVWTHTDVRTISFSKQTNNTTEAAVVVGQANIVHCLLTQVVVARSDEHIVETTRNE
jgi:hypothetical protein